MDERLRFCCQTADINNDAPLLATLLPARLWAVRRSNAPVFHQFLEGWSGTKGNKSELAGKKLPELDEIAGIVSSGIDPRVRNSE